MVPRKSMPAVHPRGCGEHHVWQRFGICYLGSSPRVRGTCRIDVPNSSVWRFIPAGAGNMSAGYMPRCRPAVHPRGCGEHLLSISSNMRFSGSSPRVRGTYAIADDLDRASRFIPAGAGNIPKAQVTGPVTSVHPRGCGEHRSQFQLHYYILGSSPRVRGTYVRPDPLRSDTRFIPAGAGNIGNR